MRPQRPKAPICIGRSRFQDGASKKRDFFRKYGRDILVPLNDYDLGVLDGRLSALRWVCGEEWD